MAADDGRAHVFGMITTPAARDYTTVALRSFFAYTPLRQVDGFVLIDNDGDFVVPDGVPHDRITLVRPGGAHGFAPSANRCLAEARAQGADLLLLNDHLVFTTGWLEPLLTDRRSLLSPLSNADVTHTAGTLSTRPEMNLADYRGHERDLEAIARLHRASHHGFEIVSSGRFFCMKIPRSVYEVVGDFDETLVTGGGEDRDYTVRARLAGIPQEVALGSFVLHFGGRPSGCGAETCRPRNPPGTAGGRVSDVARLALQHLTPSRPSAYRQIVAQPGDAMRPVVRRTRRGGVDHPPARP